MATLTSITFNYTERDIFNMPAQRSDRCEYMAKVDLKLIDRLFARLMRDGRNGEHDCIHFTFDDGSNEAIWTWWSLASDGMVEWRHDRAWNSSDEPKRLTASEAKREIKKRIGLYSK